MADNIHAAALALSLLAGSAIIIGAFLASREHIRPGWLENELNHTVTAVGGGALLAAIALVLVPEGMKVQPLWTAIITFAAGGSAAMALDRYFAQKKTAASQLMAMLMDFIPETIVIGAVIAADFAQAAFLAVIIFAQNLPESFSAYREIRSRNDMAARRLLLWFGVIGISGPAYVFLGAGLLADHDAALGMLMTFCAGGILYVVFNDVAPQAKLENRFAPPMGALAGFLIGMIGHQLTQ